jgi:3-deoxy-7-phosphoheptulonate synthase
MDFRFKRSWGPTPKYDLVQNYKRPNNTFYIIGGPCSVESPEQIHLIADFVASCGATHLRGGLFRAGTYPPKKFGWVDQDLLVEHHFAAKANGLQNIVEILDYTDESLDFVLPFADCVQIGARQMQNYTLLKKLGQLRKTVFLKRNPGATLDEFLGAAEYLLQAGRCEPVLIERGGATNLNHVRWDLSISMIPAVKALTDLPIIVDASHGTGRRDLVEPMTLAGVAAGANGFLIETHPLPNESLSDKEQAVTLEKFDTIVMKASFIREQLFNWDSVNL